MEVTLEMGCEKTTYSMQTNSIYKMNEKSFFYFIWQTYSGFHGRITDKHTYRAIENVAITVTACYIPENQQLPVRGCDRSGSRQVMMNFEENSIPVLSGEHGKVILLVYILLFSIYYNL